MTAFDLDDRVPIRFDPVPGEAFDSWLAAYAQRLDTPIPELARAIGIPEVIGMPAANLALGRPAPDAERVALAACGLDPSQLEAMWLPLARYSLHVKVRLGRSDLARAARPMRSSRYCPACLAGSGGRWPAAWRLPWFVACPRHHRLLLSTCPSCHGSQRLRLLRYDGSTGTTLQCSAGQPDDRTNASRDCDHDLSTAEVGDKPPPGLVAWQQDMVAVLDPVIEDTTLIGLVGRLADTLVLADHLGLRAESMDSRALTDTANLSTVLFAAHQLQVDLAGTEMRRVALGNANKQSWALPRTWRYAGPELTSVVLRHRDSRLNTSERLRYQTATRLAARPQHREAKQRQRGVPLTIWPDWAIRLTPPTGSQHNRYTMVLAVAICLAGTSQSINGVVGAWPWDHRFDFEIARGLHSIGRNSDATTTIEALTLLAAHLDRHGSPIDYTRRNHLAASTELIDGDSWDGICRASATPTGAATKLQAARLWIWETITGGQPYQAPQHLRPTTVQLTQYRHFELRLPDDAARLLDQHTRALLDSHGCEDEPLSWTPQLDSIDLSRLPGPDPSSVNPADVHRLLHKRHTREVVAQQLGISREHLRCIIRRHPPQLRPRSTGKRPVLRHPIPAHLTGPKLRSLIENGHSITGIAAANGLTRQNIRNELIRHGIAIPTPGRLQQSRIDPEWLRHQYLVELRVLSDIAAETGKSVTTIARLAETHGIPLRHRGSQSHQTSLRVNNDYPNPLAVAVLGQSGVERVRHFQIYATMRSLHAASCHTGKHLSSLLSQLRQLETACGGQLIARAPRQQRAQQLTPLGHELLRQADEHLGPNPDALPTLPAPLATAMNAFWGSGRLERFLITASSQTVNDAAQRIGAHADSLSISIRGLGEVVGGPLLVRAPPSAPLRLTPLGRKLSRQANLHADDLKRWGLSIPVAEAEAAPQN